MPKIPLKGKPYLEQSLLADCNLYLDIDAETKESALYMRPGLTAWLNTGVSAELRGLFGLNQRLFIVVGSRAYVSDPNRNLTFLGALNTSSGKVWIEANTHQEMICDGTYGYLIDVAQVTLNTPANWVSHGGGVYSIAQTVTPTFVYDQTNNVILTQQTQGLGQLAAGQWYYDGSSSLYVWLTTGNGPGVVLLNQPQTNAFTQVTDPAFLGGGSLAYMDTYFIVHSGNEFAVCDPDDGTTWQALNFATKEGYSDNIVCVFSDHREAWVFGNLTTEVWYDAGNYPFPLAQVPWGFLQTGCGAAASPASVDESIFWFTNKGTVARAIQYSPQVVSTRRMEWNIAQYPVTSDARGWRESYQGREKYCLSFPTQGVTWVYECATKEWHRRTGSSSLGNWQANCCTQFQGMWLVGDPENGIIYQVDATNFTDNGQNISRIWTFPNVEDKTKRINFARLELLIKAGVGDLGNDIPQIALTWSSDGEETFGNEVWRSPGQVGKYRQRILFDRMGTHRHLTYRIKQTDQCNTVIREVHLNEGL